jgi:general secretion pathway protein E
MKIEPYLLASSLLGFAAQRLARTICTSCRTSYYPSPELLGSVGWASRTNELFHKGEGCRQCHNTGFRGRIGIFEVMRVNSQLKHLINIGADESELREHLRQHHWRSLRDKALDVVENGDSTLEEVLRVTRADSADEERQDEDELRRARDETPTSNSAVEDGEEAVPAAQR